jgi:hypothetical protein
MDNIDLTSYGVAEMSQQEMVETDGGGWMQDVIDFIARLMWKPAVSLR